MCVKKVIKVQSTKIAISRNFTINGECYGKNYSNK